MASKFPDSDQIPFQNIRRESYETEEESHSEIHLKGVDYLISRWKKDIDKTLDKIPDDTRDIKYFLVTNYLNEENINEIITRFKMTDDCKEIFKCIMEKLEYHIHQFFGTLVYLEINTKIFRDFLALLKFTSKITIDLKNTSLLIVNETNLSTEDKFKLSCYFCLDKNVNELAKCLKKEFINEMCSSTKENLHLMSLWYHCCKKDNESFIETINAFKEKDESDGVPLMLWAIGKGNVDAVEYIFEKFVNGQCEYELKKFIRCALQHRFANIVCYLLSKITDEIIRDAIYKNENYILLSVISSDFRFRNLSISLTDNIIKHISELSKIDTIKTLIQCCILNERKRDEYKEYLKAFEKKFRHKLNHNLLNSENILIHKALLEIEKVHVFFKVGKISDIPNLHQYAKKLIGEQLILNNKSKIFDELILAAYGNEEEVKTFKYYFFVLSNHKICSNLLENFKYDQLDRYFLDYCEPDQMSSYKAKVLFESIRILMGNIMLSAIKMGYNVEDYGNRTLRWCFGGDEEKMDLCKKELFDQKSKKYPDSKIKFLMVVNKIAENETYDLNNFLNWAYPNSTKAFKNGIINEAALLEREN